MAHTISKRLVVLDIDGVILDSRANMQSAWQSVRATVGVTIPFDAYFALIGRPFAEIMTTLGLTDVADRCEATFRAASAAGLDATPFFPGIPDTLAQLARRGIKLAILTSKDRERTDQVLRRLPVEFDTVQTPNPRHRGKPHPDQLNHALTRAQMTPGDACYVGDLEVDATTAHRAGIDYLHASWGYGTPPAGDYLSLERPTDLLMLLHPSDARR